jgi:lipopolysaccharide export system permease protein
MRKVINQYLFREVAQSWLAVTLILLAILVINQFAKILSDVSIGNNTGSVISELLFFSTVEYLTVLMPLSTFLAILLVFGRLYKESEMAAMMASGISPMSLYRPLWIPTIILAITVGVISSFVAPEARKNMNASSQAAMVNLGIESLEPGQFVTLRNGTVLYSEKRLENNQLSNVFAQQELRNGVNVIVSKTAEILDNPDNNGALVFYNGYLYEGVPGDLEFRILEFSEHRLPLLNHVSNLDKIDLSLESFTNLIEKNTSESMAEIQWRISPAIALVILVILSIPLSKSSPRQGRFGGLVIGILVYMIYVNCLGAAKVWFEQGIIPEVYGLWWVHLIALLVSVIMLLSSYRVFQRVLFKN